MVRNTCPHEKQHTASMAVTCVFVGIYAIFMREYAVHDIEERCGITH